MSGCFTSKKLSTESIPVVKDFTIKRYTGTWYEIARLPHSFEKNLEKVTATYTLQRDGKIEVLNKGFDSEKGKWKEIKGKAWIPDPSVPARLKVRFFYFSRVITELSILIVKTILTPWSQAAPGNTCGY